MTKRTVMISFIPVLVIVTLRVMFGCEPHAKTAIQTVQGQKLGLSEAVTIGEAVKRFPHFDKVTWETRFPSENTTSVIMRGRLTNEALAGVRNRLRERLNLTDSNISASGEGPAERKRLIEAYLSLERLYFRIEFYVHERENGSAVRIHSITYEGDTDNGEIQGMHAPEDELARLYERRSLTGPMVW